MILRTFRARLKRGRTAEFNRLVEEHSFPLLDNVAGLHGFMAGNAIADDSCYLMLSVWTSLHSIIGWAGPDWQNPIIPQAERHLIEDGELEHFTIFSPASSFPTYPASTGPTPSRITERDNPFEAPRSKLLAELTDVVRQFGDAWACGDTARLEALLSPTYSHTDAFGHVLPRQKWLDYARQRTGRATKIAFRDLEVRLISDTIGLVTGINDIEGPGVRHAGDNNPLSIRFTQIWVQEKGKWLRESFQATPLARCG